MNIDKNMKLLPMHQLLRPAWKAKYAVPSFCAWNAEVTETILQIAARMKAPVILMSGPGEFALNPPDTLARIARALVEKYQATAALHLDHGDSPELVQTCLDAGYTSVMLDYSARSFEENAAALRTVVTQAHLKDVTVEGEIGKVGKVDDSTVEGSDHSTLTDPAEAARFVQATGVDALAVSIGNAHGIYTKLPVFDFERLRQIRDAVSVPLVLHGGSGTEPDYIRRAVGLGMAKINVASELCKAFRETYSEQHANGRQPWLPMALGAAKPAMAKVIERWIALCGAAGQTA
jgi:tagatose 1,6-diphosphate aldolase GatY/KbaY